MFDKATLLVVSSRVVGSYSYYRSFSRKRYVEINSWVEINSERGINPVNDVSYSSADF